MGTDAKALGADDKLTTNQAAEFLGLKPQTLATWRLTKRHPLPYLKIGGNVRYLRADLEAFLQSCRVS